MNKTKKSKQDFKKPIKKDGLDNDKNFLDEESEKKSIIVIIIAIVAVIGLIIASIFLFDENKKGEGDEGDKVEIKLPTEPENKEKEEETEPVVQKVTSKTVAEAAKYKVIYLNRDVEQIGETQTVLKLEDRIDEEAPYVNGFRFHRWAETYDEKENIYYYVAVYRQNVERIPVEEEKYLDEEKEESELSYDVNIKPVETVTDPQTEEEIELENPTYDVEIEGEVEELTPEEIDDELTIDETNYAHIIALKFNAPEGITKEQIEKMTVSVRTEDPAVTLDPEQYDLNAEDPLKEGKELLDSTEEEYENNEFYFYYYQEVDETKETIVEVYWGNDPEAKDATDTNPAIPPLPEYVEVYNIDATKATLEGETDSQSEIDEAIDSNPILEQSPSQDSI